MQIFKSSSKMTIFVFMALTASGVLSFKEGENQTTHQNHQTDKTQQQRLIPLLNDNNYTINIFKNKTEALKRIEEIKRNNNFV